jgi:hypothetical protein
MADQPSAPARSAREEVERRLYDLPYRDQVEVLERLTSWLKASEGEDNPIDEQVRGRATALDALRRAAEWLELEEGVAPTIKEYTAARQALGLDLSSGQIGRASSAGAPPATPSRDDTSLAPRPSGGYEVSAGRARGSSRTTSPPSATGRTGQGCR